MKIYLAIDLRAQKFIISEAIQEHGTTGLEKALKEMNRRKEKLCSMEQEAVKGVMSLLRSPIKSS